MSDPAMITLVSVVLSALITATGMVIAAYISKDRKAEPQEEKLFKPDGYTHRDGGMGRSFRKIVIFIITMSVIAIFAKIFLSGGFAELASNNDAPTAVPTAVLTTASTIDPCKDFVTRVYKGSKVKTANVLNKNLNIRKSPSLSALIITSVQNGTEFQIIEGPICADGLMWWRATMVNGSIEGWIAEVNSNGTYYIQP